MTKIVTRFVSEGETAQAPEARGWYVHVETEHGGEVTRGPFTTQALTGIVHGPFQTKHEAAAFGEQLARELNADLE